MTECASHVAWRILDANGCDLSLYLSVDTEIFDGKNEDNATVVFPDSMLIQESDDHVGSIISETYPHLKQNLWSVEYFQERAILAPTHEMVDRINDRMLDLLEGDETLYQSSDSTFAPERCHQKVVTPSGPSPGNKLVFGIGS
ncbi:hypothetical protein CTI12_AA261010 [Artemisia annua]|uniref:Uncharacterized protein n=1 Tax=Artemisia annua TaxID=35608 RepID=A0A2U1NJ02_ARTAN|nr:hypothetical protein CTI12_AA261010 [Artemisia annua]